MTVATTDTSIPIESVISPDLVNRCLGRLELVERILRAFDGQVERDVHDLRYALGCGDLRQVASISHRMKGAAANCAMVGMAETASQIESLARSGQPDGIGELVERLSHQLEEFRVACQRDLAAPEPQEPQQADAPHTPLTQSLHPDL